MAFKVESNIPLPAKAADGRLSYPFRQMGVGDSFFVPVSDGDRMTVDRLTSAASYAGSRHNMKFSRRKVDGGYRVWRLS